MRTAFESGLGAVEEYWIIPVSFAISTRSETVPARWLALITLKGSDHLPQARSDVLEFSSFCMLRSLWTFLLPRPLRKLSLTEPRIMEATTGVLKTSPVHTFSPFRP